MLPLYYLNASYVPLVVANGNVNDATRGFVCCRVSEEFQRNYSVSSAGVSRKFSGRKLFRFINLAQKLFE